MNKINNKVYLFQVFSSYSGFNFFSHNPNCTSGTQYSSFGPVVCIVKPKKKKKNSDCDPLPYSFLSAIGLHVSFLLTSAVL